MSPQRTLSTIVAVLPLTTGCVQHQCDTEESGCILGDVALLQTRVARDENPSKQIVQITLNKENLPKTSDRFDNSLTVMLRQGNNSRSASITKTDNPYIYDLNFSEYIQFFDNGQVQIENNALGNLPPVYLYYKAALAKSFKKSFNVSSINNRQNFAPFRLALTGPTKAPGDNVGDIFLLAFSHSSAQRFADPMGSFMYKYKLPPAAEANPPTLGGMLQATFAYGNLPGYSLATSYYLPSMMSLTFEIAYPPSIDVGSFDLYRCSDADTKGVCAQQKTTVDVSIGADHYYSYRHLSVDPQGQLVVVGGRTGTLELRSNQLQTLQTGRLQTVTVDYLDGSKPVILAVDDQKMLIVYRASESGVYQDRSSLFDLNPLFPSSGISAIAVGDINGDKLPDIAVAGGKNIRFLINHGDQSPQFSYEEALDPALIYQTTRHDILAMTLSDLDGDGLADTIVSEPDTQSVAPDSWIDIFYTNNPVTTSLK